ncbi:MAG: RHS repeat-associated core domain-containing protein, partial [Bacteroidales bacterium]
QTGYNNYGARYYYDWASIWLSVDPMSDKYPHLTSYNYCANNPVMLIDPDGEDPKFFAILRKKGQAIFGNSLSGDPMQIGAYTVVPVVNNSNKIIAYNAGRESANGEYRTEYQMEPGDLEGFKANVDYYEAAANLFYTNGEPNINYAMLGDAMANGDFSGALGALGNMWGEALNDPSFVATTLLSFAVSATNINSGTKK